MEKRETWKFYVNSKAKINFKVTKKTEIELTDWLIFKIFFTLKQLTIDKDLLWLLIKYLNLKIRFYGSCSNVTTWYNWNILYTIGIYKFNPI